MMPIGKVKIVDLRIKRPLSAIVFRETIRDSLRGSCLVKNRVPGVKLSVRLPRLREGYLLLRLTLFYRIRKILFYSVRKLPAFFIVPENYWAFL